MNRYLAELKMFFFLPLIHFSYGFLFFFCLFILFLLSLICTYIPGVFQTL